jgi:carbon monoxide dehydrogenase subunit G
VGEAGAIPTGALFAQAVEDALQGTGVEIGEIPLSPGRLFTLVEEAKRSGPRAPAATRTGRTLVLSGTREFAGTPDDIYALLLDPEVIASTMPGTQRLERMGDRYEGALRIGIGPISAAKFGLVVRVSHQLPPESYRMDIEARGAPGFVTGVANVLLAPGAPGHTRMDYRAELRLGGTLAAVGQRMLDSVSKVMSAQGLKALERAVRARSDGGMP